MDVRCDLLTTADQQTDDCDGAVLSAADMYMVIFRH